ncbi:MAG: DNA translocase FtsK 4TM domain-containing protein [Armatimonadetes bacterium]|nr:DNA translocase FtsK 4TM domain-containing protein [Armatimonadota bacterium]
MPTQTRTGARKSAVAVAAVSTHRHTDVGGIILVALGVVMLISLAVGKTGLLGDALTGLFRGLFGKAAWFIPFGFLAAGTALITGKSANRSHRIAWGVALVLLAVVGFLAQEHQGDYFDPEMVSATGGYVGAVVRYLFAALLGQANAIGMVVLALVGAVLVADTPIRMLLKARAPSMPQISITKPGAKLPARAEPTQPQTKKQALREALIRAAADIPLDEVEIQPGATVKPLKTKAAPIIRETKQSETAQLESTQKEGYILPPVTLLREAQSREKRSAEEMQRNIETLERTLEEFGIEANVVEIATGPTITRYEVQLGPGIRVSRITQLADNIAMSLSASHVRVEAPIPGKNAIGVEVPNLKPAMVSLRELCETKEFVENPQRLLVGLGQDVSGHNKYADLTRMPHLLIGGATNSGKSIGLATIITSLLMRNTPKDLRLVMIDPKRVELSLFDHVPHLMCPVVKDVKEAPGVLRAIWREMDIRYDLFSEKGVRNIDGWNSKVSFAEKLPYIVVIIDELADLMIQASAEVETSIVRLAQLARAVGIHLIIATQRPSADVITGLIKANIPSRIAFAVSSSIDSRIIIDGSGADKLVGRGDMLFMPIDANKPTRIQGCYVSEKEIEDVCHHWKEQEKPIYVLNPIQAAIAGKESSMSEDDSDPLWEEAVRFVVDRGQASTSMLQRKFSIGFQRASRLLDMMEERGIVGPRDGPRPREVLVDPMEVETMFGRYTQPPIEMDPLD